MDDLKKAARRKFAKRILDLVQVDESMEMQFVFGDEKLFKSVPCNEVVWVRREVGESWKEEDLQPKKNSKSSAMIWLYICAQGKGELFLAENKRLWDESGRPIKMSKEDKEEVLKDGTGFDNYSYVQMIEKQALPGIRARMNEFHFVQDNCSVHTSTLKNPGNTVYDVFQRNNVNYIADWPANSPDLHPVENALKLLATEVNHELGRLIKQPKNKFELFAVIQKCWQAVDNEKVQNCYNSFVRRLKLCLLHAGGNNFPTDTKRLKNRKLLEEFDLNRYDSGGNLL